MKYNIIGDIHSRRNWKGLLRDDCINVFVGDYFAYYRHEFDTPLTFNEQVESFNEIIEYKKAHPETVLLLGNHDTENWQLDGYDETNRYDRYNATKFRKLFEANADMFQIACSLDNKAIVTHAGVSMLWFDNCINNENSELIKYRTVKGADDCGTAEEFLDCYLTLMDATRESDVFLAHDDLYSWKDGIYRYSEERDEMVRQIYEPDYVADKINEYWNERHYVDFAFCSKGFDRYGEDPCNSPIWIRPSSLLFSNIFKGSGYWQFMGHTQFVEPVVNCDGTLHAVSEFDKGGLSVDSIDKIVFVDCLGQYTGSVVYDSDSDCIELNRPNAETQG